MADAKMQGMAEIRRGMNDLPAQLMSRAARPALLQAAAPIVQAAKDNFQSAGGPRSISDKLRSSIHAEAGDSSPTRVSVHIVAGGDDAYYALWVEKGHINRKAGGALSGPHPARAATQAASPQNTPAHQYMRPALDDKAQEAFNAFAAAMGMQLAGMGK